MNRPQQQTHLADTAILRLESGAIDYTAYDVRARKERSKAFHAAAGTMVEFVRSSLIGIAGALAGIAKTALQGARNCDPARLEIGPECPRPLGS